MALKVTSDQIVTRTKFCYCRRCHYKSVFPRVLSFYKGTGMEILGIKMKQGCLKVCHFTRNYGKTIRIVFTGICTNKIKIWRWLEKSILPNHYGILSQYYWVFIWGYLRFLDHGLNTTNLLWQEVHCKLQF